MGDPHELSERAAAATARGQFPAALALYVELEQLEPTAAAWPKRIAETLRRLGRASEAIGAAQRAVEKYVAEGMLVSAIGVCKLILQIDPDHTQTAARLGELATPRAKRPTLPVASGALDAIPLAMVMPESHRIVREDGTETGISVIAIDDLDDAEISIIDPRDAIRTTPIFAELPAATLEALIANLELRDLGNGDEIFHEGDRGTEMFVVSEGEVTVEAAGQPIATLKAGECFGEIALVTDLPRSATVRANGRVELLVLDRAAVRETNVIGALLKLVKQRLVDRVTRTSALFRPFADPLRTQLASRFEIVEIDARTTLITEGVRSDGLYVMLAGSVEVIRDSRSIATLASGDVFGEMSLMSTRGSTATVRATTRALALRLPANVFADLIMTYPQILEYLSELQQGRSRLRMAEDFLDLHVTLV